MVSIFDTWFFRSLVKSLHILLSSSRDEIRLTRDLRELAEIKQSLPAEDRDFKDLVISVAEVSDRN